MTTVIELILLGLFVSFMMTQIILPTVKDNRLFPLFRRRKIEKEIVSVKDELDLEERENLLNTLKKKKRKKNG